MLVGRETERARIDALLAGAREGRGGALVLRGEPGIGKSALLADARSRATDMRVLHARGVEAEAELVHSGLHELLRPVADRLDALPALQADAVRGALGLGPGQSTPLLVGAGTLSLLAAAAEERPLLCLVDDAHWLDAASADALTFAARRLEDDPVVVLFAAREGEARTFAAKGIAQLSLEGLASEAAAELLRDRGMDAKVAAELQRAAVGNPLALLELPRALSDAQRRGEAELPDPLAVTEALQAAFAGQIASLPAATRLVLLVAAAEPSGRLGAIERACVIVGADAGAMAAAEDAHLIGVQDGRVTFRHPLISAAAYAEGGAAERRRVHAALAEAADAEPSRAWHLAAAAAGPDEETAAALEHASRSALADRSAFSSAATMLERAATLTPAPARRAERLWLAGVLHFYAGAGRRSVAALGAAERDAADAQARRRIRLLRVFVLSLVDPVRAVPLLLREAQAPGGDAAHAATSAALSALVASRSGDGVQALRGAQLATAAGPLADPLLAVMAADGAVAGGVVESLDGMAERALPLVDWDDWRQQWPERWLRMLGVSAAVETLLILGEHEALAKRGELLMVRFDPTDLIAWLVAGCYLGLAYYQSGRWAEGRAQLAESAGLAVELERPRQIGLAQAQLAQMAAAQGDESRALAHAEAASGVPATGSIGLAARAGLGLLALGRGEYDEAADRYERDVLGDVGPFLLRHDVADAIESYVRAGRLADAAPWLTRFGEQAGRAGWPWALARSAHLRGLLGEDDSFTVALRHHDRARQPFLRARTELALGERLRRAGQRRTAREPLRTALNTFEALEALPWAQRAAAELRATGERVRRRDDPDTSRLTAQELQVALVVARGATNKEAAAQLFLSPKTIEKHLGAAYSKLGVRSRAELARLVAEQPSAPALV